jgi:hypothetical protein
MSSNRARAGSFLGTSLRTGPPKAAFATLAVRCNPLYLNVRASQMAEGTTVDARVPKTRFRVAIGYLADIALAVVIMGGLFLMSWLLSEVVACMESFLNASEREQLP